MKNILIKFIRLIAVCTKIPYYAIRQNQININSYIGHNVFLNHCKIGKYCYVGRNSIINYADIGNYVSIAPLVQIGGMEHSYWRLSTSTHLSEECMIGNVTRIGNDVWIGANCVIKQGVHIGDGAVIGAGSFVNKDVQAYSIVFGVPAKVYKYRFDDLIQSQLKESNFYNYSPSKAKELLNKIEKCK